MEGASQEKLQMQTTDRVIYVAALTVAAVLVTIIVVLVAQVGARPGAERGPQLAEKRALPRKGICSSTSCIDASRRLLTSLSRETAPCANFYEFVCEGWKRKHPVGDDLYPRSVLGEAQSQVKKRLMLALETTSIPRRKQSHMDKLIALYRSCSSSPDSVPSMRRFLALHNHDWPRWYAPGLSEFFTYVSELDLLWHLNVVYRYTLQASKNGHVVVSLYPYVPERRILRGQLRLTYQSLVHKFTSVVGGEGNFVDAVDAAVTFDARLAAAPVDRERLAVAWANITRIFPGLTPQMWLRAFRRYRTTEIKSSDTVHVHSPHYFRVLMALLLRNIDNGKTMWYIGWRFIMAIGCQTSYEFRHQPETQALWPTGECEAADAHSRCRAVVRALMKPQWNGLVTKVLLTSKAVFDIIDITRRVRSTLEEKIRQATWMDSATRIRAFSKLELLREFLPKFFVFEGKTPAYDLYSRVPDLTQSFVDNWLALKNALGDAMENVSLTREDPLEWSVSYSKMRNALHVNVGILTSPVYSYGLPAALNFAGLGALVAREYTRAFDWEGGHVDGAGKINKWWSDVTSKNYEQHESCFALQLRKMMDDAQDLLPEVIAQSSGMRLAYLAYKLHGQETGRADTLGGFTDDQLFFASFCYVHCQNAGHLSNVLSLGERSVGEILCNVAVMNMAQFSDAFGCSEADKMGFPSRCKIW